mgnify:FL=1
MYKTTYTCVVLTPMFLYGADRKTPELRPSSFKGIMRFWWRAINGNLEVRELKKKEGEIFGGIDKKEGQSTFSILTRPSVVESSNYQPLPHHTGIKGFKKTGFSPGEKFEISLVTRAHKTADNKKRKAPDWIGDLFETTCLLGGFGNRSRRGFGSVAIEGLEPSLELIGNKLNRIYGNKAFLLDVTDNVITSPFPSPTDYPSIKKVSIGQKSYASYQELLITIGKASSKYNPSGSDALGKVRDGRLASPVFVSVLKFDGKYWPIVTTLNIIPDEKNSQNKFTEAICG